MDHKLHNELMQGPSYKILRDAKRNETNYPFQGYIHIRKRAAMPKITCIKSTRLPSFNISTTHYQKLYNKHKDQYHILGTILITRRLPSSDILNHISTYDT